MATKPLVPRNWQLNKSKEKPSTVILRHGAYPQSRAVDQPSKKTMEKRKARITLPKLKFMDD